MRVSLLITADPAGVDLTVLNSALLRVYRGLPTPIEILRNRHFHNTLPVPETDKNFLISPPGSPPVGWEQIREDPPNVETLADDLARALEQLSFQQTENDQDISLASAQSYTGCPVSSESYVSPVHSNLTSPRGTIIVPHRRTESGDLPSVLVSNTDMEGDAQTSNNGLTIFQAYSIQRRTTASRSPGPISQVKATIESMQATQGQLPSNRSRIDRTPRPPLHP